MEGACTCLLKRSILDERVEERWVLLVGVKQRGF